MRLNLTSSRLGEAVQIGDNIYIIKTLVAIGGGDGHLTHKGLRQRFLHNLQDGREEQILQEDDYTTEEMLNEEIHYIRAVRENRVCSFDIDTTTTVIKLADGSLVLHSPTEATISLVDEVAKLGSKVSAIIAPNLQHWLGCSSWISLFPNARVYVAPAANGECLLEKLGLENSPRAVVLGEQGSLFDGQIKYRLLQGAPLMLNEVVFLHDLSKTLLVADAYYTGHCCTHYGTNKEERSATEIIEDIKKGKGSPPNAFTRVWFKMTKKHWCSPELPIYRTSRVLSNGNPEVLVSCIRSLVKDWAPTKMIGAHGDRVVEEKPGAALIRAWSNGVLSVNNQS